MGTRRKRKTESEPRFAQERQARIAEALRSAGRVEVSALAREFAVSEDTVRRDLRLLASRGLIQKTHGGAVALYSNALPMSQRLDVRPGPKRAIAREAASRVLGHQTLFIDGGSTTLALAQVLAESSASRPLTVITAAFDVAALFASDPSIHLILAGGTWSFESREFFGEQAQATIRAHRADWAFLGACALHERAGLTSTVRGDAQVKRAMIESAATVVVLADATKHGQVSPYAVAELKEIDLVITDEAPSWLSSTVREVVKAT